MGADNVTEAFTRWKAAQDDFIAAEQKLFQLARAERPFSTSPAKSSTTDALTLQVQAKRAHAETLLMTAMRLLHERRKAMQGQSPGAE